MYNIMLVEWDSPHQIASRLGIGRIFKEAWDMSLPVTWFVTIRWGFITLEMGDGQVRHCAQKEHASKQAGHDCDKLAVS